jgi:sugar phosphate isomerase/epimerase
MRLLLHTIALEPARWTPQRTSRPLVDLLPHIAAANFRDLEIYEPHLGATAVSTEIRDAFGEFNLTPEILSSYLNLNPSVTRDSDVAAGVDQIRARIDFYGFRKLRLFPGPGMSPSDEDGISLFVPRLERLINALPDTEILLETHDGSLADDPAVITRIVREFDSPRVGLLYQPTFFEPQAALRQLEIQKSFIRHLHLQNRKPNLDFAPLNEGVIPWDCILQKMDGAVSATLEFVPVGICSIQQFDLAATLRQARAEADSIATLSTA